MGTHPLQLPAEVEPPDGVEVGCDLVARQTLGEGEVPPGMTHHVDERVEAERPARIRVVAEALDVDERRGHQATEDVAAGGDVGRHSLGADPAVLVPGPALTIEPDAVDHGVALHRERVAPERREHLVGPVAEVGADETFGQAALYLQAGGLDLVADRGEPARQVRMARRIDRRQVGHRSS